MAEETRIKIDTSSIEPNSHKYREQKRKEKLNPVVNQGDVVSTKKSIGKKLKDTFLVEDLNDIKNYILFEVIIPGAKDALMNAIEAMFYGRGKSGGYYRRESDYYPYHASYNPKPKSRRREREDDYEDANLFYRNGEIDCRNIVLKTRPAAERVVQKMRLQIREYGSVSLAELCELLRLPSNYNDNNWGWVDERDIQIRRVSSGYLILVPEPAYLR